MTNGRCLRSLLDLQYGWQRASSFAASAIVASRDLGRCKHRVSCTAIGCADVDAPAGGWVKRSSAGEALFGCSDRLQTWKLRCRGDQWIGIRHNCTRGKLHFIRSYSRLYGCRLSIAIIHLCDSVCLSVRTIKPKRLKLKSPNLVQR